MAGRTLISISTAARSYRISLTFPQGGVTRRPGFEHIAEGRSFQGGFYKLRLIPFEFNVEQTYVLEFSAGLFRVYKDGGIVVDSGGNPIEVVTPYSEFSLAGLKFTQSADIMYIVHPSHAPRQITRTDHDAWTITEIDFRRGPLLDPLFDGSTVQADGRTGTVTVTGVPVSGDPPLFFSNDVNRLIKLHDGYVSIDALIFTLNYTNKSGAGSFSGNCHLVSNASQNFTVLDDDGTTLTLINPAFGAIGDGVEFQNEAGTITAETQVSLAKTFISSNEVQCTVQQND